MQEVLGDPQEDLELNHFDCKHGHLYGYDGFKFDNKEEYIPLEITLEPKKETEDKPVSEMSAESEEISGTFLEAKYRSLDVVQILYNIDGYFVVFNAIYKNKNWSIQAGREIYYGIKFIMSDESISAAQVGLCEWREKMLKDDKRECEVINTTYFSAQLNCDFYEWEKGLTEEEGVKRIIKQFPNGIPCKDGSYYHLATFHVEPHKVPCYHPENGKVAFAPFPYPVVLPQKCNKPCRPPKKRKDCQDDMK